MKKSTFFVFWGLVLLSLFLVLSISESRIKEGDIIYSIASWKCKHPEKEEMKFLASARGGRIDLEPLKGLVMCSIPMFLQFLCVIYVFWRKDKWLEKQ